MSTKKKLFSKFDHIGIAVENLEMATKLYGEVFTLGKYKIVTLPERGIRLALFDLKGIKIELLESLKEDSVIARFIRKRGPGLHHICFGVKNLDTVLSQLAQNGIQTIDTPRMGSEGKRVVFFKPETTLGVLIELIEDKKTIERVNKDTPCQKREA
ncbi:MAG: methylmalonyl-CoA epimerase [Candidatus Edwardsbacteria bacterium]